MNRSQSRAAHSLLLGTSALFSAALLSQPSFAGGLPSGGTVVSGGATISNPNSTNTVINQTTNKAVINWQDFSIASGSTVTFNQPGSSSVALNRVVGPNASSIFGDLIANGQVWLINGNGIMFGKGSQINVGALIATTADINNQDFLNGNYAFGIPSANPNASVINNGTIKAAQGGSVILGGPVVQNNGIIQADLGNITLGGVSTFSVDFQGDNLLRFQVGAPVQQTPVDANGKPVQSLVSNTGTLSAKGGKIVMTSRAAASVVDNVINNSGMIEATSVAVKNGEVVLDAGDGTVDDSGSIDVSGKGTGQTGGSVTLEGKNVVVADGAKIAASGDAGGGTVLIGGDTHGQSAAVQNAQTTTVGKATITADAIHTGNGGKVVVWSDQQTKFNGSISAQGGSKSGNGGFVETSGENLLVSENAAVNTLAAHGQTGTWLLDPTNIYIQAGGGEGLPGGVDAIGDDEGATDTISPTTIINALSSTDVRLEATNDIFVVNDVVYSSDHALSLLAEHDIHINADIQNTRLASGGAINIIAGWDGITRNPLSFGTSDVYGNNGGVLYIGGEDAAGDVSVGAASGTVTASGYSVIIGAVNADAQLGFNGGGGGNINVNAVDDVTVSAVTEGDIALIGNGGFINADVGGNLTVNAGNEVLVSAQEANTAASIGNTSLTGDQGGDIQVNTGGLVRVEVLGDNSGAFIGNWALNRGDIAPAGGGTASGNINVTAGEVQIYATGVSSGAQIGNGLNNTAATGGITVNAGDITLTSVGGGGAARIGAHIFNGSAPAVSGDILVQSTGDILLDGQTDGNAIIGSGAGGQVVGDVTVTADGSLTLQTADSAQARIGNSSTTVSGDISVTVHDSVLLYAGGSNGAAFIGSQANTSTGDTFVSSLTSSVTLDSEGPDNLVQIGRDGYEASPGSNPSISGDVTVEANDEENGFIQLLGNGSDSQVIIGHVSFMGGNPVPLAGKVTVQTAGSLTLEASASTAYVQIGNHGAGTGGSGGNDVDVSAKDLTLLGGEGTNGVSQIGNGSLNDDILGDVDGNVKIVIADQTQIDAGGGHAWLGNANGETGAHAGDLTVVSGSVDDESEGDELGDAVFSSLTGGNVFLGVTGSDWTLQDAKTYDSDYSLTLADTGNITLASSLMNSGSGALNIVAGWDGTTLGTAHLSDTGVFGNDGGSVTVGGETAEGSVNVGTVSGTTNVLGDNVYVDATNNSAQLGIYGTGGGDINVTAINQVELETLTGAIAQIGNGGYASSGPHTGNITINAGSLNVSALASTSYLQIGNGGYLANGDSSGDINISLTAGEGENQTGAMNVMVGQDLTGILVQIGNGGGLSSGTASGGITVTGVALSGNVYGAADVQIGNGGFEAVGSASGDIGITLSDAPTLGLTSSIALNVYSDNAIFQIGNGGARSNQGASTGFTETGDITLTATDISMSALGDNGGIGIGNGGDATAAGTTLDGDVTISGDITINAGRSLSLDAEGDTSGVLIGNGGSNTLNNSTVDGDITESGTILINVGLPPSPAHVKGIAGSFTAMTGGYGSNIVQIGNGEFGSLTGTTAAGTMLQSGQITLNVYGADNHGGSAGFYAYAPNSLVGLGNGSATSTAGVEGDIFVNVDGALSMIAGYADSNATIGNTTASSGNVVIDAFSASGLEASMAQDIPDGDFTLRLHDANGTYYMGDVSFDGPGQLTVLSEGDLDVLGQVQNSGAGGITLIAGWDGTTTDSAHFIDSGVYGNGGHSAIIGGEGAPASSVGSAGGKTIVAGYDVSVLAYSSDAQIGFTGNGGGNIDVRAVNDVNVVTQGDYRNAEIGNGGGFGQYVTGDIDVTAGNGIHIDAYGYYARAMIGNSAIGGGTVDGNITLNAHGGGEGGGLVLAAHDHYSLALVGHRTSVADTNAQISGDIGIYVSNLDMESSGQTANAQIGHRSSAGTASGDIYISADDVTLNSTGAGGFARIGDRVFGLHGDGDVDGSLEVYATGDISLYAGASSNARIETAADSVTGHVTVDAGGGISLESHGAYSNTWIGAAGSYVNSDVSVTAADDISLYATGEYANAKLGSQALEGGNAGLGLGDLYVESDHGGISLIGNNGGSAVIQNLGDNLQGDITVKALDSENGSIYLKADGGTAAIGSSVTGTSSSDEFGILYGDVTVTAGTDVSVKAVNGGSAFIGSSGPDVESFYSYNPYDQQFHYYQNVQFYSDVHSSTHVVAGGDVSVYASGESSGARIGAAAQTVTGDTSVYSKHGNIELYASGRGASSRIGSVGDSVTGDISVIAQDGGITLSAYYPSSSDSSDPAGVAIGSKGASSVSGDIYVSAAGEVYLYAGGATYAQIGHHSGGDLAGDITVYAGSVYLAGYNYGSAQIGHSAVGDITSSDILVKTTGDITLYGGGYADYETTKYGLATIGSTAGGDLHGDITVHSGGSISMHGGDEGVSVLSIGNATQSLTSNLYGDINVTANDGITLSADNDFSRAWIGEYGNTVTGDVSVESYHGSVALSAAGYDTSASISIQTRGAGIGTVTVKALDDENGYVSVVAGGNHSAAFIGATGYGGPFDGSISVQTAGKLDVEALGTDSLAQIGSSESGTVGIDITAGSLNLEGGYVDRSYALIGNGSFTSYPGNVSGDINIHVSGDTYIYSGGYESSSGKAWIGNVTEGDSKASGNVTLISGTFDAEGYYSFSDNIAADLGYSADTGGNVLIGFTGQDLQIGNDNITVYSPHTLSLLSVDDVDIGGNIQNSGSGGINIVAGWDGTTIDPAHFTDSGVYGNNGGSVHIGGEGASSMSSIGTAGGLMTVAGSDVDIYAVNGNAILGYTGSGGGDISVYAAVGVNVIASGDGTTAAIGNGFSPYGLTTFETGPGASGSTGDITVHAGSSIDVYANADDSIASIGNYGLTGNQSGDISLTAGGGVNIYAGGTDSRASVGNWSSGGEGASGNITVSAASLYIGVYGDGTVAQLGNGAYNTSVTGDITINTGDVTISASGDTGILPTARLGGSTTAAGGTITGDIDVEATGSVTLTASNGHAYIGGHANGNINGDVKVVAGGEGSVSLNANGDSLALIGNYANSGGAGSVTVTAGNDIDLSAASLSTAIIGGWGSAGSTTVTSTSGSISLDASGEGSLAEIGRNDTTGGDVTVHALGEEGSISLTADGADSIAEIGSTGTFNVENPSGDIGTVTGNIDVEAANDLSIESSGDGAIAQVGHYGPADGDIKVRAASLNMDTSEGESSVAQIGNSSGTNVGHNGNVAGDIDIRIAGVATFNEGGDGGQVLIGNTAGEDRTYSGSLLLLAGDFDDESVGDVIGTSLAHDIVGGDVTLGVTDHEGAFGPDHDLAYSSSYTLNVLSTGDVGFAGSVQNSGTGNINVVAGWDGETLAPANFGNSGVFGSNGHGVVIGGSDASGGVAVGSSGGATNVYGASLTLAALTGYAQLGYHGAGSGAINVNVLNNIALNGGTGTAAFAQIGNGGYLTNGNAGGNITITAGGDVNLNAGSGSTDYAQIGNGGSNTNASAANYTDNGNIVVHATNVNLTGGSAGSADYAQIGNGGFKAGAGLTGTFTIGGDISVIAGHTVVLNGGAGADAYAQIGNGGSQVNLGAGASAHGAISGNIIVQAPNTANGAVNMTSGNGANAYTMVGNGGYNINGGTTAPASNFTVNGNITVADLNLFGGGGNNAFSQIGNGDNSHSGTGNILGDIIIQAFGGNVNLHNGTGNNSDAGIHNATGNGTVGGTVTGFSESEGPGNPTTDPGTKGTITTLTNNKPPPAPPAPTGLPDVVLTVQGNGPGTQGTQQTNPIEEMSGGDGGDTLPSDETSQSLGNSLKGGKKSTSTVVIGGLLKQNGKGGQSSSPHAIPHSDENYSSWGNEALWQ